MIYVQPPLLTLLDLELSTRNYLKISPVFFYANKPAVVFRRYKCVAIIINETWGGCRKKKDLKENRVEIFDLKNIYWEKIFSGERNDNG